jgi:ribosomal protein L21E
MSATVERCPGELVTIVVPEGEDPAIYGTALFQRYVGRVGTVERRNKRNGVWPVLVDFGRGGKLYFADRELWSRP